LSSLKGFTFDNEKLDILLRLFEQGQMSQEQAEDLKLLLEPLHKEAIDKGDFSLARKIASILMTLKGFLSGRISLNIVENVSVGGEVSASKVSNARIKTRNQRVESLVI
jgi:hypothetical protein